MTQQLTSKQPIGVYDSGIGGLTVLKALKEKMPQESFVYFADTLHLPYGNKTVSEITQYSQEIIAWFQDEVGAKLVVAACHTSSALALEALLPQFSIPIIGTIHPMIHAVCHQSEQKRVGIIATPASVASRMHETIFKTHGFMGELHSIACPDFVPLIESHPVNIKMLQERAQNYLGLFKDLELSTLIYGCTHYPFARPIIEAILPKSMNYIDPAHHVTLEVFKTLHHSDLLNQSSQSGQTRFYSSLSPQLFETKLAALAGLHTNVELHNISTPILV